MAAIADAGVELADIDGLFTTPPALTGLSGFMWSCTLAHHLGLRTKAQAMVECGGMSSSLAFKAAVREVEAGRCRCALVVATDVRADDQADDFEHFMRNLAPSLVALYGPYDGPYGLAAPIPYYAMSAQRYLHEFESRREDFGEVAVQLRKHAADNPLAQHRKPITVADVLAAEMVCPPLGLLDCSPFASGAAALVVTGADVADGRHRRVSVRGIGEAHEAFRPFRGSLDDLPVRRCGREGGVSLGRR
jgi:acetyl-CoA C-acetyltransferase